MRSILQQRRVIAGLLVVIFFAPIAGSSLSAISPSQTKPEQQSSNEIEAEVTHWSALLKSGDQEERRDAVMRLSHIKGDAATSALLPALSDPSPLVRAAAVAALGERADSSVASALAARLSSDKNVFVRKTAAYALGKFSGTERTASLIAALRDKEPEVRGAAAVSLGDHADAAAIGPLTAALADKNAFVRAQAARALGVNGRAATQEVPALIALLASDTDGEVRRQAAIAIASIGDRSALPALERAARDSDPYLAQAARASIKMIEGK